MEHKNIVAPTFEQCPFSMSLLKVAPNIAPKREQVTHFLVPDLAHEMFSRHLALPFSAGALRRADHPKTTR